MSRAASGGVLATEGHSVAMEGNPGRECYPGDGTEGGMRAQRRDGGQTVVSSLALQMFLYFNCYFFPFWWACHIVMLDLKYFYLSTYYRITLTALIVVMTLVEVARLYLGYLGNLQEKVPALAGSWLLSLLLQAPMLLFHLFNPHLILLPVEWATGLLYLAFITTEIVLSIRALRRLAAQLEERFHLAHLHLHQERAEGETA